jgi:hypothetical protein
MSQILIVADDNIIQRTSAASFAAPAIVVAAGDHAARRFLKFFAVTIENPKTREACPKGLDDLSRASAYIEGEPPRTKRPLRVLTSSKASNDARRPAATRVRAPTLF